MSLYKVAFVACVGLGLSACGGGSSTGPAPVTQTPVATVSVTAPSASLLVGTSTQASAVTRDAASNVLSGRAVTWSTSNAVVASVSQSGLVVGVSAGSATITATSEGRSGSIGVTVSSLAVATVDLNGASRAKVGDPYSYTATARTADGTIVQRSLTWSILTPGTATITSGGVLVPLQPGAISVVATIDGVAWIGIVTAYDWVPVVSGTVVAAGLVADASITNAYGASEYPTLLVGCSDGTFVLGIAFSGIVTYNGLITYSADNGTIFNQEWLESSPNYDMFIYPGLTNLLQKNFALSLATNRTFVFAFSEYLGVGRYQTHVTNWRITGMPAAIAPALAACPGNSLMAGAPSPSADLVGRAMAAFGSAPASPQLAQLRHERAVAGPLVGGYPTVQPTIRAPGITPMRALHR